MLSCGIKQTKIALCIFTVVPIDFTVLYSVLSAELSHFTDIALNGFVGEFPSFRKKGQNVYGSLKVMLLLRL